MYRDFAPSCEFVCAEAYTERTRALNLSFDPLKIMTSNKRALQMVNDGTRE